MMKSNNFFDKKPKFNKLLGISLYLLVWIIGILSFYLKPENDAMGFTILYIYILLPITNFIVSFIYGINMGNNKKIYMLSLFFGIMQYLFGYLTFDLLNSITYHKFNIPDFADIIFFVAIGIIISILGIQLGKIFFKKNKN